MDAFKPLIAKVASGLPLADEFNRSLARALTSRGFDSQPVVLAVIDRVSQVRPEQVETKAAAHAAA